MYKPIIKVPFSTFEPMHNEIRSELNEAFERVLNNSYFILGELFEREFASYCGTKFCVGVGTGLDALTLILRAMDIGAGDEVIVPSNTFIATALAVSSTGAIPVFVEPDIHTYNINAGLIERKITSKTKAIIAVHLQGRPADMDVIVRIAKKYHLRVIEDAAQSHGCITTDDEALAVKVRTLANYGSDYKYHHIYKGVNSRLDEMQAAFLRVKLLRLDLWNQARQKVAEQYFQNIHNPLLILPPKSTAEYEHIYHVFAVRCPKRDELEEALKAHGIGVVKHYPVPIHRQKAYCSLGIAEGELPVAEEISRTILSIPMFYGMKEEEINYVVQILNSFG